MRTLWNIYTKILIGVVLFVLFAAGGVNYYTKTQSDAKYYAKTQADTTFVKVADLVTPTEFDTLNITAKATVPTMAQGTSSFDAASAEFVQSNNNRLLNDLQYMGSNIKLLPFGAYILPSGVSVTVAMTDGRFYGALFVARDTIPMTGFGYSLYTAGDYTADNYNGISLYKYENDMITKVTGGETADDGNIWKVTGNNQKALPAPITLLPGIYYARALWNASATTTAPVMSSFGTAGNILPGTTIKPAIRATAVTTPGASYVISATTADVWIQGIWMY